MAHSSWIAAVVIAAVIFFGLAVLGMVGLTRAGHRTASGRGWPPGRLVAFTAATALVAFMGGWLIYLCWWPFARLVRPWPRLRIVGPAIGAAALLIGGGIILNRLNPTAHPTFINDTGRSVTISGCTDDPATFSVGERSSGPYVSTSARSCFVYVGQLSGCLTLPPNLDSHTIIRLSDYTQTDGDCK